MGVATGSIILAELLSEVRTGDILVMRRPEPISQVIRWMDDSHADRPVDVSHSMLVLSGGDDPEGFSVWPLADADEGVVSDVVISPLRWLTRPYDRVVVLRHKTLAALDEASADSLVAPVVDRARAFLPAGQRGSVAFDDKQLYAKALAFIGPSLRGARGRLASLVMRRLDQEIRADGAEKVVCPELIMRAFNEGDGALAITTSPTLPAGMGSTRALDDAEPVGFDGDLSEVAWNSLKRELQVAACAIAADLLARTTLAPPETSAAPSDQMIEYTTPGDLQRSADLVVVGAWEAWTGRIDDVWSLPGGRKAVKQERLAGPSAPPLD